MGKLIYLLNVSLDGFVETPDRSLDWSIVDDELHTWFNDQTELDASLYGRRMYEVMAAYWPTAEDDPAATETMLEYAASGTRRRRSSSPRPGSVGHTRAWWRGRGHRLAELRPSSTVTSPSAVRRSSAVHRDAASWTSTG